MGRKDGISESDVSRVCFCRENVAILSQISELKHQTTSEFETLQNSILKSIKDHKESIESQAEILSK